MKNNVFNILILFILSIFLFTSRFVYSESLDEMENIISECKDLEDFLSPKRAELRERYFIAAQAYYGGPESFKRVSFDAILGQLKLFHEKRPKLADNLWKQTKDKPFSVQAALKTSGRDLNLKKWHEIYQNFIDGIEKKALPIEEISRVEDKIKRVEEIFFNIEKYTKEKIKEIEAGPGNKKSKEIQKNDFMKEIKKDPSLEAALAFLIKNYFRSEQIRDFIVNPDPDLLLEIIQNLNQNPKILLEGFPEISPNLITHARELLPTTKELLADTELLPIKMYTTKKGEKLPVGSGQLKTYDFKPVPRNIHGIWKGIERNECVGGNPGYLSFPTNWLTPRRWAINALDHSHLYMVESDGVYHGYNQMVRGEVDHEVYYSLDVMSPVLSKEIISKTERGHYKKKTLYDLWLELAPSQIEHGYIEGGVRFIMGQSVSLSNGGMIDHVHKSDQYLAGKALRGTFAPADRNYFGLTGIKNDGHYGKGPIIEAMVPGAGTLIHLVQFDEEKLKTTKEAVKYLLISDPIFLQKRMNFLTQRMNEDIYFETILEAVKNNKDFFSKESLLNILFQELAKYSNTNYAINESIRNVLEEYLKSRNERVALSAARALLKKDNTHVGATELTLKILNESNLNVFLNQKSIQDSLWGLQNLPTITNSTVDILKNYLKEKAPNIFNNSIRRATLNVLLAHRSQDRELTPFIIEQLANIYDSKDLVFFMEKIETLGKPSDAEKMALLKIINGKNKKAAAIASAGFLRMGGLHPDAIKNVVKELSHSDFWLREKALNILSEISNQHPGLVSPYQEELVALLMDEKEAIREKAFEYLKKHPPVSRQGIKKLYSYNNDDNIKIKELLDMVDPARALKPNPSKLEKVITGCGDLWKRLTRK